MMLLPRHRDFVDYAAIGLMVVFLPLLVPCYVIGRGVCWIHDRFDR